MVRSRPEGPPIYFKFGNTFLSPITCPSSLTKSILKWLSRLRQGKEGGCGRVFPIQLLFFSPDWSNFWEHFFNMVDHINAKLLTQLFVFSLLILDLHLFISTLALLNIVLIQIFLFAQIIGWKFVSLTSSCCRKPILKLKRNVRFVFILLTILYFLSKPFNERSSKSLRLHRD